MTSEALQNYLEYFVADIKNLFRFGRTASAPLLDLKNLNEELSGISKNDGESYISCTDYNHLVNILASPVREGKITDFYNSPNTLFCGLYFNQGKYGQTYTSYNFIFFTHNKICIFLYSIPDKKEELTKIEERLMGDVNKFVTDLETTFNRKTYITVLIDTGNTALPTDLLGSRKDFTTTSNNNKRNLKLLKIIPVGGDKTKYTKFGYHLPLHDLDCISLLKVFYLPIIWDYAIEPHGLVDQSYTHELNLKKFEDLRIKNRPFLGFHLDLNLFNEYDKMWHMPNWGWLSEVIILYLSNEKSSFGIEKVVTRYEDITQANFMMRHKYKRLVYQDPSYLFYSRNGAEGKNIWNNPSRNVDEALFKHDLEKIAKTEKRWIFRKKTSIEEYAGLLYNINFDEDDLEEEYEEEDDEDFQSQEDEEQGEVESEEEEEENADNASHFTHQETNSNEIRNSESDEDDTNEDQEPSIDEDESSPNDENEGEGEEDDDDDALEQILSYRLKNIHDSLYYGETEYPLLDNIESSATRVPPRIRKPLPPTPIRKPAARPKPKPLPKPAPKPPSKPAAKPTNKKPKGKSNVNTQTRPNPNKNNNTVKNNTKTKPDNEKKVTPSGTPKNKTKTTAPTSSTNANEKKKKVTPKNPKSKNVDTTKNKTSKSTTENKKKESGNNTKKQNKTTKTSTTENDKKSKTKKDETQTKEPTGKDKKTSKGESKQSNNTKGTEEQSHQDSKSTQKQQHPKERKDQSPKETVVHKKSVNLSPTFNNKIGLSFSPSLGIGIGSGSTGIGSVGYPMMGYSPGITPSGATTNATSTDTSNVNEADTKKEDKKGSEDGEDKKNTSETNDQNSNTASSSSYNKTSTELESPSTTDSDPWNFDKWSEMTFSFNRNSKSITKKKS